MGGVGVTSCSRFRGCNSWSWSLSLLLEWEFEFVVGVGVVVVVQVKNLNRLRGVRYLIGYVVIDTKY